MQGGRMVGLEERLCEPTAEGIRQCLCMLAEEAALLNLPATAAAIEAALRACQTEQYDEACLALTRVRPLPLPVRRP